MSTPFRLLAMVSCASITALCLGGCFDTMLIARSLFNTPADLVVSPGQFPDGTQGTPYDASLKIVAPVFSSKVYARYDHSELPPGLTIEVLPLDEPRSADSSQLALRLSGIPAESGTYEFDVNGLCCMTMSGPGMHAKKRFSVTIERERRLVE